MDISARPGKNRLRNEKSPYLLQHQDNPVDWFAWGDEAFEKAREENKPVLVSIGYATCHWCHVMADESFSDPETARIMNDNLVSIKIDREERPDLDQVYITAVSALTGSAGWPLNVFLTHDAKPFFGGTYFPLRKGFAMASWKDVVKAVGRAWKDPDEHRKLLDSAEKITAAVKAALHDPDISKQDLPLDKSLADKAVSAFAQNYDSYKGGFSQAPKFPMPTVLRFLLFYYRKMRTVSPGVVQGQKALEMAVYTMKKMAEGGIYDHLGGGFHRYSTDASWHVPHFEKMLYDNAQMISVYLDAFHITGEEQFSGVARQTLDYIEREMTHEAGGFYSAQDADSYPLDLFPGAGLPKADHKSEGAFYAWKKQEIQSLLNNDEARIFCLCFGVKDGGNIVSDPTGEFEGKNILYRAMSPQQAAAESRLPENEVLRLLDSAAGKLYEARNRRPKPFRDEKILTEWNAMMISALVKAYRVLGDDVFLKRASRAVDFIKDNLISSEGRLFRRWGQGHKSGYGLAGDYAMLIQALLDLYIAVMDPKYLKDAADLADEMLLLFFDKQSGGFFMTAPDQDKHLIMRVRDFTDNVIASANSVAVSNCVRLFRLKNDEKFYSAAEKSFRAHAKRISANPQSAPQLLEALVDFFEVEES